VGGRQSVPHDRLYRQLAFEVEGVSPLLLIERLGDPAVGILDLMVEAAPEGSPLSAVALPLALAAASRIVGEVAAVLARLHARGDALGTLHAEQVFIDDELRPTGLVPRARRFLATAAVGDVRRRPLSRDVYHAPEVLAGAPATPASDVFSLAAILAHLVSGEPAFPGDSEPAQSLAIACDRRRPWRGPASIEAPIAEALAAQPAARPTLADFTRRASETR
jgi:serine/threonine protein kinase